MLLAGSEVLPSLCNLLTVAAGIPPPPLTDAPGGRDTILPRPRLGGMGGGAGAERPLVASSQLSSSLSPVLVET